MGICVGMQLLADIGYENEKNDGFGISYWKYEF